LKVRVIYIFLVTVFFSTGLCQAQAPFRDFQVWQNFEVEYVINKRWLGHMQEQARLNENSTQFYYYYLDFGLMYKLTKNIRINVDYVFIQKKKQEDLYSNRHQYNFHLNVRKKYGRITLLDRMLTEGQYADLLTSTYGKELTDIYLRNKLSVRYKFNSRLSPYISDEVYFKFDGDPNYRGCNRNRTSVGFVYKLTDNWLFETSYMFEHNFNTKAPSQNFVLGVGITRSFFQ